jgi:hypothetical protein
MKRMMASISVVGCLGGTPVLAAPLDALLTAQHAATPGDIELEVGYDLVNGAVDIFNIRDSDAAYAGTNVGDYRGAHVRGGIALSPSIWLDGALWQRRLDYRADLLRINSWQIGAQYKALGGIDRRIPSMAARLSAWGNYSDGLNKSSPTTLRGQTLNTVQISQPKDVQVQIDLIGTAQVTDATGINFFGSVGASQVSIQSVGGSASIAGCNYTLFFTSSAVLGQCNSNGDGFSIPNSVYGIDVFNEAQYKARFASGGFSVNWQQQNWHLRGGYQFQRITRQQIDNTIQTRDGIPYQSNHIFLGEVTYRVVRNTAIFVRGQYMTNQFIGEIPFAYNTMTAGRFDKHYGILSTGLAIAF